MSKTQYGVEINIYAYDEKGLDADGANQGIGDRNGLTESDAKK